MIKVLLLKDVEKLGRGGDVVTVQPGYARNFLLPKGVAILADKNALRLQEKLQEERRKQAAIDMKESEALAERLKAVTLVVEVKVDPEGHMYGSVSVNDITSLLEGQEKITLDKQAFQIAAPIKSTGVHQVEVKLKEGVIAAFALKIIPEGAEVV